MKDELFLIHHSAFIASVVALLKGHAPMFLVRLTLRLVALIFALALIAYLLACVTNAQQQAARNYQPDMRRALATRPTTEPADAARPGGYAPQRPLSALKQRPMRETADTTNPTRKPAHPPARKLNPETDNLNGAPADVT